MFGYNQDEQKQMLIRFISRYSEWQGYTLEQKTKRIDDFPNSFERYYTLKRKEEAVIGFIAYDLANLYTHWWKISEALDDKNLLEKKVSYYMSDDDRKNNRKHGKKETTIGELVEEMSSLVLKAGYYRKIGS